MWCVNVMDKPHRGVLGHLGKSSHKAKLDLSDNVSYSGGTQFESKRSLNNKQDIRFICDMTLPEVTYLQQRG